MEVRFEITYLLESSDDSGHTHLGLELTKPDSRAVPGPGTKGNVRHRVAGGCSASLRGKSANIVI